jgi:hypothetical protein
MIGLYLAICTSLAGELVLDAKVPAALTVDGLVQAQLYYPGRLAVSVDAGEREVVVTVAGKPTPFTLVFGEQDRQVILAGRTGITVGEVKQMATVDAAAAVPVQVQLRATGPAPVMVQIGRERFVVDPRNQVNVELTSGEHPMRILSIDGMMVYARGTVVIGTGQDMVIHVKEGSVPEVAGEGLVFRPDHS